MPKKVLIPIDWSEGAEHAFNWYAYNFHKPGMLIILTHYIEASKEKEMQKKESEMQELQEVYENILLKLKIDYQWVTGSGSSPGEHIVRLAKDERADLIVIGARGLGKIKKAILGSVSDHVVSKAKCPVLICKYDKK